VRDKLPVGAALKVVFEAPAELARFIAPKGSICVSGVSLTVNGVAGSTFDVMLIPHTRDKTSLDGLAIGSPVNLEVDILARYVARLLEVGSDNASSNPSPSSDDSRLMERLRASGFI
jgi:riboflavin synthase